MRRAVYILLALWGSPLWAQDQTGAGSVDTCKDISPDAVSSFLFFNPPGYKVLYDRSSCYNSLALSTLDEGYCDQVREKKSLLLDGSALTPQACRARVQERLRQNQEREFLRDAAHQIDSTAYDFDAGELTVQLTPDGLPGIYQIWIDVSYDVTVRWQDSDHFFEEATKRLTNVQGQDFTADGEETQYVFALSGSEFEEALRQFAAGKVITIQTSSRLVDPGDRNYPRERGYSFSQYWLKLQP